MSDNRANNNMEDAEKLEKLENLDAAAFETAAARAAARNAPAFPRRSAPQASDELPEVLYRLKTLHSSETSYGYFVQNGSEWPRFRTERELEDLLEGPIAQQAGGQAESGGAPADSAADLAAGIAAGPSTGAPADPMANPAIGDAEGFAADPAADPASYPTTNLAPSPAASSEGGAADAAADAARDAAAGSAAPQAPAQPRIPQRALVIAPTKYGKDVVEVQGVAFDTAYVNPDELVLIERPAGIDDLRKLKDNKEKEKRAYELCRNKIWARNLPMKLVSAHYLLDEPKILFYFTAESRVDFRELVKDLVSLFKLRIELRQIGVRDEARVTGGCGVCGRVLCCHSVSDRLNPVSIKMAKDQNLSLNSLKISGPCGRLLCCLSYEYQFYKDARRELPQEGAKFVYDGTLFKVVEVNALSSVVRMAGEDGRVLDMKAERFKYSEGRWKVIEDEPQGSR